MSGSHSAGSQVQPDGTSAVDGQIVSDQRGEPPRQPQQQLPLPQLPESQLQPQPQSRPSRRLPRQRQRQHQSQQQRQQQSTQQQSRQSSQSQSPSSLPVISPTPRRPSRLRASVETLVRKLSRQNLLTSSSNSEQPKPIPSPTSEAPKLPDPLLTTETTFDFNVGKSADEPSCFASRPLKPSQPLEAPLPDFSLAIEIDQDALHETDFFHQAQHLRPHDIYCYNAVINDPMDMQPEPAPALPAIPFTTLHMLDSIEPLVPDPAYSRSPNDLMLGPLEVDEAYMAQNGATTPTIPDDPLFREEAALLESFRSMRRQAMPGGTVRRNVDGIPLRFRLSADAALRCQNLVRSKVRMRKRKTRDGRSSVAGSIHGSVAGNSNTMASGSGSGNRVSDSVSTPLVAEAGVELHS